MAMPTFGIFDHIEGIPGTSTPQLLKDRLEFVRAADQAGFVGYHLAEHHGTDLCLAPNQEMFIAAASQITDSIRMGPLVKLLPMHHPVRIVEDMCLADNLTNGRIEFGVGRGPVPVEHFWFGSDWPKSKDRFEDVLAIVCRALRSGEVSSEGSQFFSFPTMPIATHPVQEHIPFWYPGNPVTAGRYGLNLMWPGPIDEESYQVYLDAWNSHRNDEIRFDGPESKPKVGCTMLVAIADDDETALEIADRSMKGLMRRTHSVHQWDVDLIGAEAADAALGPLRHILSHIDDAVRAGAGTAEAITDRLGAILADGRTDYIVLQIPVGDMTMEEARHTFDVFCEDIKPKLEAAA